METIDVLKGARELLSDPSHWTQGELALDAAGFGIDSFSEDAVCWCLLGALDYVADNDDLAISAGRQIVDVLGGSIVYWNDMPGRTHAEVLELLDKAIAL